MLATPGEVPRGEKSINEAGWRFGLGVGKNEPMPVLNRPSLQELIAPYAAMFLSILWLFVMAVYINNAIGWGNLSVLLPNELGGFLAGAVAPIALLWVLVTYFQRGADLKRHSDALLRQLRLITFPAEAGEIRARTIIASLAAQTEEMSRQSDTVATRLSEARAMMVDQSGQIDELSTRLLARRLRRRRRIRRDGRRPRRRRRHRRRRRP